MGVRKLERAATRALADFRIIEFSASQTAQDMPKRIRG